VEPRIHEVCGLKKTEVEQNGQPDLTCEKKEGKKNLKGKKKKTITSNA